MKHCYTLLIALTALSLFSCTKDYTGAHLRDEFDESRTKADAICHKGNCAIEDGNDKKAAKAYDLLAERHPTHVDAPESVYKAGQCWENVSDPRKAFDSYQTYITTYRNGEHYQAALDRQSEIAFGAANGSLQDSFLGLKSEPDYSEVISLLTKLRDNAPASDLAARAQFAMGTYSEGKEKARESTEAYFELVDTYPQHKLAPEANLRAGKILAGITKDGNQNSSNLKKAKDTMKDLIQQYPNSTQAKEAQTLLSEVDGLDVQRTYEIAEFYEKKGNTSSAKYYYEEVLEKAQEGSHYHKLAQERAKVL